MTTPMHSPGTHSAAITCAQCPPEQAYTADNDSPYAYGTGVRKADSKPACSHCGQVMMRMAGMWTCGH